jgi:hypothetical protein
MSNGTDSEQAIWPGKLPEFFYRYDTAESVEKILRQSTLMFSSPRRFNDPFDCRIRPLFQGSREQFERMGYILAKRRDPNASPDKLRAMVQQVLARMTPESFERVYQRWERNILDNSGILCLSEICDDILMWSHYAEHHAGVCLQFRFETNESFPDLPLPIAYSGNYPEFNFTQQFADMGDDADERQRKLAFGKALLLTKSVRWSYEKEWRVIRFALDGQPRFGVSIFPPSFLTGLILGCRIGEDKRQMLIELARAREPRLRIFEAHTKEREFALDIRQIA